MIIIASQRIVTDNAQTDERCFFHIANLGHGARFHIHRQSFIKQFANVFGFFNTCNKLIAAGNQAFVNGDAVMLARFYFISQIFISCKIERKVLHLAISVGLQAPNIIINGFGSNHNIHLFDIITHAAGHTGIYYAIGLELINQLGGLDRGANLADAALDSLLSGGRRVLLVPGHDDIRKNSVGWLFTPDFWNWSMFKRVSERAGKEVSPGTLSLINDPGHPLFTLFPNDGHSDWQWWSICLNSRPLIMDSLDGYVPVLQVVDNVERCHKLGIISEFAAGNGSLLVCTVDLDAVSRYPEGRAFISSLLHYAASDEFKPSYRLEWDELLGLLYGRTASRDVQGVENTTDYSEYVSE